MLSDIFLQKILSIQSTNSTNNGDRKIIEYIKRFVNSNKLRYDEDEYGNIYITKGKSNNFPCITSHIDTVHSFESDFKVLRLNNKLYAMNQDTMKQAGIGGDDKVGVAMCLTALKELDNIKVVFFRDEENGRKGSNYSIKKNKKWYDDCAWFLACDRRGRSDLITSYSSAYNDMVSEEFMNDHSEIFDKYKYTETEGLVSDATQAFLNEIGICCFNISVGYYNPHTSWEYVIIDDAINAYSMLTELVNNTKKRYEHKLVRKTFSSSKNNSNFSLNSYYFNHTDVIKLVGHEDKITFSRLNATSSLYEQKGDATFLLSGVCPICNANDSLYVCRDGYMRNLVYCVNHLGDVSYAKDKSAIFKHIIIKYADKELVWCNRYRNWLDKTKAVWCNQFEEWILK